MSISSDFLLKLAWNLSAKINVLFSTDISCLVNRCQSLLESPYSSDSSLHTLSLSQTSLHCKETLFYSAITELV